jgi:tetratricopeptide (TPR) repeat protein
LDGSGPLVRLLAEKLPLLLLAGATGVATLLAQKGGGAMLHGGGSLAANLATALAGYGTYLAKMVWPVDLAFFYPLTAATVAPGRLAAAAAVLLAVSGLAMWQATRRPYLLMGWGWYLVTLLPVSGLIRVGAQAVADRYTYLPLIGIFIMVVWGGWDLAAEVAWRERLAAGAAAIVLVVLAMLTWLQTGHWRNNQTLYSHALAVTEGNWLAEHNLGTHLLGQGDVNGALARYREALRLNPRFDRAHNNLGRLLLSSGHTAEAIDSFNAAIASNPQFATAYLNLGHAYLATGRPELARGVLPGLEKLDPATAASLRQSIEIADQRIRPRP